MMQEPEEKSDCSRELNISFGYQCNSNQDNSTKVNCEFELSGGIQIPESNFKFRSSSFSCLSGAALSANCTLANTNICNGLIGEEILPGLDSPRSFRRLTSSPSFSSMDLLSSSQSSLSTLGGSMSMDSDMLENNTSLWKSMSLPTKVESSSFLNAMDVQMAGGAAGEDRVQAVCSEENGWLFCGVYDGFNGRDAADFLAGTLYENIGFYFHQLEWRIKKLGESGAPYQYNAFKCANDLSSAIGALNIGSQQSTYSASDGGILSEAFRVGVLDCLVRALAQAESDFMYMVEQSMQDRPDIVSVGSCVLTVLLHGQDLYILNLGDSRAVLATCDVAENGPLHAIQLTEIHTVDNEFEYKNLMDSHPDDPSPIVGGRVKGKLKLTRAFGVGYLKKRKLNDALMGILRVRNLCSPPYVSTHPFTMNRKVSENDLFVVLGSDGLFDFFTNEEVVGLVHQFIQDNPAGDPAKHLVELLVLRAAENAGPNKDRIKKLKTQLDRKFKMDLGSANKILRI